MTPGNREKFWIQQAERLLWRKKWDRVENVSFHKPVHIRWFEGGELNVCENCVDRHLPKHSDKVAIFWEPDSPNEAPRRITYRDLFNEVCRWTQALESQGVRKGDCVAIYMPMIPEAVFAMLACARIGAVHSVIFAGFSSEAVADRLLDGKALWIITADEAVRGGKSIPLKKCIDEALHRIQKSPDSLHCPVKKVLMVQRTGQNVPWNKDRDVLMATLLDNSAGSHQAASHSAEDPLFMLYTSGSTNKPKGVLHGMGGYLVYASYSFDWVFAVEPDDVYFCTADVGWITGHSYLVYGPLSNARSIVMFEGVPQYPTPSRLWEIIDKYRVTHFYTAPTAIRALMAQGDDYVKSSSLASLKVLGSVGEPINPEAWNWYHRVVGHSRLPIVDTWWQTETGGILISPSIRGGALRQKPGSATRPLPEIEARILSSEGHEINGPGEGVLVLARSWPGQMRTVFGDHARFEETYFSTYPGYYFTGDAVRRDEDGDLWINGRVDDVINVSGHRLGTAEIESALVSHPLVAEAAVVGSPHPIKGQGICCFVILKQQVEIPEDLPLQLSEAVKLKISPIAKPDRLYIVAGLPKTRSGKIMRRILRKLAEGSCDSLGDTSTLAEPGIVDIIAQQLGLKKL